MTKPAATHFLASTAQVADPTVKMAPVEVLPLKHPIEYSFGDLAEVALEKPALGSLLPHPPTQLRPLASPASAGTGKTTLEASRSSGNRPSAVEVNRLVLSKPAWGAKGLSLARPTHQGSGSLGGGLRCFSVRAAPARVAPSRAASAPGVLPGGHLLQKAVTSLDGAAPRSSPSVSSLTSYLFKHPCPGPSLFSFSAGAWCVPVD